MGDSNIVVIACIGTYNSIDLVYRYVMSKYPQLSYHLKEIWVSNHIGLLR